MHSRCSHNVHQGTAPVGQACPGAARRLQQRTQPPPVQPLHHSQKQSSVPGRALAGARGATRTTGAAAASSRGPAPDQAGTPVQALVGTRRAAHSAAAAATSSRGTAPNQAGTPVQALAGARRAARSAAAAATSSRGRMASSSSMCWMAACAAAGEACASGLMVRPEMVTTCAGGRWWK